MMVMITIVMIMIIIVIMKIMMEFGEWKKLLPRKKLLTPLVLCKEIVSK